jgi:aspartyl aminopeptidase
VSKKTKSGYLQVGVELYGGGIWASWFDRDLSLAGRVIVSSSGGDGAGFTSKLVKIDRPLLRIPTLAIHLDRTINDAFKFNKETEFAPIIGLVTDALNGETAGAGGAADAKRGARGTTPIPFSGSSTPNRMELDDQEDVAGMEARHHPMLLAVLADELGCSIGEIQDFEL